MIDLRFYWSLLMRRLPVMLALLIICSAFGAVWAIRAPSTYSATTQLLVEEPQITVEREGEDSDVATLQVIEQQLMTRANLIDIANKLNVFAGEGEISPDDKVTRMRAQTSIRSSAGRGKATMMTISFTSPRPRTAAAVVNEMTTLVLSANTRSRVGRAEDRLSFYQQEVERLNQDLDQQNARILEFKRANSAALPENLAYRQSRQSLLQERIARLESEKASLEAQRTEMIRLYEETGNIQQSGGAPQTPEEQALQVLQLELNSVLGVYAEDSPRVKALRNRVAAAERAVEARIGTAPQDQPTGNSLLNVNLSQMDTRSNAIQDELTRATAELDDLQGSINATSANSIALGALERDQANIQARYNAAVASLGEARTAERIESSARGERISVIESASVPNEPSGPNRLRITAMGIGLGLALAAGFFALMEFLNNSIRRPAELRSRFQITPLAVIPYIESRQERRHRQWAAMALILGVLVLIPLALWGLHTRYMPLDLLAQKIIIHLGLG
jgi:uncharacterized protein involved in exopolysaccharide biosynthesis